MFYTITCRGCENTFAVACSNSLSKGHLYHYHGGDKKVRVSFKRRQNQVPKLVNCNCSRSGGHN